MVNISNTISGASILGSKENDSIINTYASDVTIQTFGGRDTIRILNITATIIIRAREILTARLMREPETITFTWITPVILPSTRAPATIL